MGVILPSTHTHPPVPPRKRGPTLPSPTPCHPEEDPRRRISPPYRPSSTQPPRAGGSRTARLPLPTPPIPFPHTRPPRYNAPNRRGGSRTAPLRVTMLAGRSGGMVDAPVSKTGGGNPVSVRIRPSAPLPTPSICSLQHLYVYIICRVAYGRMRQSGDFMLASHSRRCDYGER